MKRTLIVVSATLLILTALPAWGTAAQGSQFSTLPSFNKQDDLVLTLPSSPPAVTTNASPPNPVNGLSLGRPQESQSVKNDTSPALASIAPLPPSPDSRTREIPIQRLPRQSAGQGMSMQSLQPAIDSALQAWQGKLSMPLPIKSFEGINNRDGLVPPDPNGDVGPNHYVQWVNASFAVWDKNGNRLYGPTAGSTLWTGFGGACETKNDGDPIVLYDSIADRWLMSQFAMPNGQYAGPYYQCIAVSQTPDPTGSWYRYAFLMSNTKMNDYPKFGVWPDGYYMSINQFNYGSSWGGAGVVAFERDKMLSGLPARTIYIDLYSVNPNFGGMLPADLDGHNLPPLGSPNYFAQVDPPDRLSLFRFHVDWANTANSTFSAPTVLNTAAFSQDLCGLDSYGYPISDCVPQPGAGSPKLDALNDRLMYRLQYRNFGDHESLVVNHTVDAGSGVAGVRWYEIRDPGGTPSIYQQGTFAPDSDNRWMGSIAMDGNGDMALGYSVSSTTTNPSIRYAGRLITDALGILPQAEITMTAGIGSQTGTGRWGDYSSMSIDPTDDCTFWYTQEYYQTTSPAGWQTRVGSFKFPSCSVPLGVLQGTVSNSADSTSVVGAQISATSSPTHTAGTMTGAGGAFSQVLSTGSYAVTASACGYLATAIIGVPVAPGITTTQPISLSPVGKLSYATTGTNVTVTPGMSATVPLTLINNCGSPVTATYQLTDTVPWLSVVPSSGNIPPDGSQSINLTFDSSTAITTTGSYYGLLQIIEAAPTFTTSIPITLTVTPPVPDFTASPTSGFLPLNVSFTDRSVGTISARTWDFGDGVTNTIDPNPVHTYTTPGVYTVTLAVTGGGASNTITRSNYISVTDYFKIYLPIITKNY